MPRSISRWSCTTRPPSGRATASTTPTARTGTRAPEGACTAMTNPPAPSCSSAEVRYLHPELAPAVFAAFAAEIARACEEHGFLDTEDALGLVKAGRFVPLAVIIENDVRGL